MNESATLTKPKIYPDMPESPLLGELFDKWLKRDGISLSASHEDDGTRLYANPAHALLDIDILGPTASPDKVEEIMINRIRRAFEAGYHSHDKRVEDKLAEIVRLARS